MTTIRRHAATLLTIAGLAGVAAPVAHAQAKDPGAGSGGRACVSAGGGWIPDGGRTSRHWPGGERGTSTCTDGERCDTWTTKQGDGSWAWFSECVMAPVSAGPDVVSAGGTTPRAR